MSYLEQITKIIADFPTCAVRKIRNNLQLWDWVTEHGDPASIDNKTLLYTAISGERVNCPCGSGKARILKTVLLGFYFCGNVKHCSYAKKAVQQTTLAAHGVEHYSRSPEYLTRRKVTCLERYGVENPSGLPQIRAKIKETNIKRYGIEHGNQCESSKQKKRQTNLERYGVDNPFKNSEIKNTIHDTMQSKYGVHYELLQDKKEKTCLDKYGVTSPMKRKEIAEKAHRNKLNIHGEDSLSSGGSIRRKIDETNFARYGGVSPASSVLVREKIKTALFSSYGVNYPRQAPFSDEAKIVLGDIVKFEQMLTALGVVEMSRTLGVAKSTIYVTHNRFNLNIITAHQSSYEMEIIDYLVSLGVTNVIQHDRVICKPKELDIVVPDYRLAIEFNGIYWHSEYGGHKPHDYHKEKLTACSSAGYRLLTIFEDEWLLKKDICKSIISQNLGKNTVIPARKCVVGEVKNTDVREFLDKNHIQGWTPASKAFALWYNNDIVAVMTFGHPRYNKAVEFELIRLASKISVTVIGGSNKLWSFAKKTLECNSVISYCDKRWFTGKVYNQLGFVLNTIGEPTYWYTDYSDRWHRSKYTKKRLMVAFPQYSELTESHITREILELDRIWDCGQDTWIWHSTNAIS